MPPVRPGELTVDEDRAAGVFAARRLGVWRNEPIGEGFNCGAFGRGEEQPAALFEWRRWRGGVGTPGQTADDRFGPRDQAAADEESDCCEKFSSMKTQHGRMSTPVEAKNLS